MVTPAVDGIDLFKIAGRSISGWIPSFKMGAVSPLRQPFCRQLEERLLMWLEYHPQVVSHARGDIGPAFASAYRLPLPKEAPFAIGYTFEGKPHHYLPDAVGTLRSGALFIAEAGMEDDKRGDRNLAKAEALQIDALKAAGCEKWFVDKITGSQAERKGLNEALAYVRPGDTFIVRKLKTNGKVALARQMFADQSHSIPEICAALGISRATLYRYVKEPEAPT